MTGLKAADVINAAVEIERKGHQFYLEAQKNSETETAKDFFAFMAEEELRHEKVFEAMLQRLGGVEIPAEHADPETLEYVAATLDSHLLFAPGTDIKGQNPFMVALGFEKDTILYFMSIMNLVPKSEQKFIEKCIEEEKKHLRLISKKRQDVEHLTGGPAHRSIFVH